MHFLFWFVLYPLSILPLCLLYVIAFILNLILNYVVRYRRKVIDKNLRLSFPEKSLSELKRIRRKYYWHLSQIAIEMLKMLTLPRHTLKWRYKVSNPEVVNRFYEEGKSVILMSSHYNNWEWMVLSLDSQFKHHGVGVGKANSNKNFEKLINRARTRYGTEVVFADTVKQVFESYESQHIPVAYMMLSDQSPGNPNRCYVTDFLNQKSGVIFGAEHYAKKYDIPVVYYQVIKDRIGVYHLEFELITDKPLSMPDGAITETYVKLLEKSICQKPEFWLWSHRRWKHHFE